MRILLIFIINFLFIQVALAQDLNKYWIFFNNKKNTTFNPYEYFDVKTIERRIVNNVSLTDSTDFPLCSEYKDSILQILSGIKSESRWLNGIVVFSSKENIEKIKALSFVKEVKEIQQNQKQAICFYNTGKNPEHFNSDLLQKQVEVMQGSFFQKKEINGKGVRIAVFDAGFPGVDRSDAFEHLRENKKIIKTWDFVKNKENVYKHNSHGTMVLSCIAGISLNDNIGLATGAEFLLARTEQAFEPFSEEENWLAAAEWADKNGAQIISSSLGYTGDRYFYEDMNGTTSLVSKAATMAARKGILVVNAMGNDGTDAWKFIGAPADADSILSVGGIDPASGIHIDFSSFGPTYDKRVKPNVCAYADVIAVDQGGELNVQGTSFATPLVAGFAACALQVNPGLKVMELLQEIEKSGHLYPYFDYAHGYGIPQAGYFTGDKISIQTPTFHFEKQDTCIAVICSPKAENTFISNNLLYYHIQNPDGFLVKYAVVEVYQQKALLIPLRLLKNNNSLKVYFKGYTDTYR